MTSRSLHRSSLAVVYAQGLDFGGAGNATVAWHRVGEYPKKRYGEFTKYTKRTVIPISACVHITVISGTFGIKRHFRGIIVAPMSFTGVVCRLQTCRWLAPQWFDSTFGAC